MITNPEWLKAKIKPYLHQISLGCIEEIAAYIEDNDIEEVDCGMRTNRHLTTERHGVTQKQEVRLSDSRLTNRRTGKNLGIERLKDS